MALMVLKSMSHLRIISQSDLDDYLERYEEYTEGVGIGSTYCISDYGPKGIRRGFDSERFLTKLEFRKALGYLS